MGGRSHAHLDGRLEPAPETTRPSCQKGAWCHPGPSLPIKFSAPALLTPKKRESAAGCGHAPDADAASKSAEPNALLNPPCGPPRQACAPRYVDTRKTAATAKPTPFRHHTCRHGRGPLGRPGLTRYSDVRRSSCVFAAARPYGIISGSRTDTFARMRSGAADCRIRQRRPGNMARRRNHRRCTLCSVGA